MIVSVNWLKKFTDIDLPVEELATLIGARLVEIEEIIDLGAKYKDVIVARVVECEKLEGSDHLSVAKLDDGKKTLGVERDENGCIQVVCGAPNVRAGLLIAWLPPKSIVPETYGSEAPFVLDTRTLRGVTSNGMIASAKELDLYDDHTGILELDKELVPGSSFADGYELDDYLLDIENKSLTHRPDCFGIIGFAREVAAIQGKQFTTPEWLLDTEPKLIEKQGDEPAPKVSIDDPELSDRYQAVILSESDGSIASPLQIQTYLARVGVRPISAVVDVTNYLMLLTGQPLHAFDYDKVKEAAGGVAEIHVRAGLKDEKLKLLDGRTIELTPDDIVIAAGDKAIGLAGAMGGASTEIDENTKNVILESATFNLYNLRATQMRHGIFSEAITRFTKGQPAALAAPVLAEAVRLMADFAHAKRVSEVADSYPARQESHTVKTSVKHINDVLGTNMSEHEAVATLQHAEFSVGEAAGELNVTPPYWRRDVHIPEDVVEEVGRLRGYDEIIPTLPRRSFEATRPSHFDEVKAEVRRVLARGGANEVLTYSFVHGDMLTKSNQKAADSYRIVNSLSPDLQYYRQTLTPSLLSIVHQNVRSGYGEFGLFEVNKVHPRQHGMTDEGVPAEVDMVAAVVTSKEPGKGAAYYKAKKLLDFLARSMGLDFMYVPIEVDPGYPVTAPFEPRRAALVTDRKTDTFIGIVGEYKKSVTRAFKLPEYTAGFEIGSIPLLDAVQKLSHHYSPISRYPGTERDICFQVAAGVQYYQIVDAALGVLQKVGLDTHITPVDIYQSSSDALTKNITIRISLTSRDHTLEGSEVAEVIDQITQAVVAITHGRVI